MVDPVKKRASGKTAAEEEAEAKSDDMESPVEPKVEDEERKRFAGPRFRRMRTDWNSKDRQTLQQVQHAVNAQLLQTFPDLYDVLYGIYEVVRQPKADPATGEIVKDMYGLTEWETTAWGAPVEDWSKMTSSQKERFVHLITVRSVEWHQRASDLWGEAMFAKTIWEEQHAEGFQAPRVGTVDDRNAAGTISAAEERYFAVYASFLSRKADKLVDGMDRIALRLKDTLTL